MAPRADDEHYSVPTWRLRQLQDIEHAARQCVELIKQGGTRERSALVTVIDGLLTEALGDD